MERSEQLSIAEALILASPEPIPLARLASLIPSCKPAAARALVDELNAEYVQRGRAFEIWEVAGGFQLRTLPAFASYVQASQPERPLRLSQASLETLSVVAYRQPVTRAEIEHVRGVDAGPVLRSLLERHLVRIAGHREVPGRPLLYATSRRFLEVFGLARIEDLPTLRELAELAPEGPAGAQSTLNSVGIAPDAPQPPGQFADQDELEDPDDAGESFDDDEDPRDGPH
jgi:segregation and condensation protein B